MSDPGTTYRTREEIQHMRSTNDPITGLKLRLIEHSVCSEEDLKLIEKQVRADIDADVEAAKASPEPSLEKLYDDIYVNGTEPDFVRGCVADEGKVF